MSTKRLNSELRGKELMAAISRIDRGRAKTKATKVSIASVAKEAGVSTALIHNCHPDIAEVIREKQGRSSRAQRDAKHAELKEERAKNRELRAQVEEMRSQIAQLTSINEVAAMEIATLRARLATGNVSPIGHRKT